MEKNRLTFGVLIDWVYSGYHQSILSGIVDFVNNNDINLLCFVTGRLQANDLWERGKNIAFNIADNKNIDGLIVLTAALQNVVGKEKFSNFLKKYIPLPIVSIAEEIKGSPSILINNEKGLIDLLNHLVKKHSYKKIAFITGPKENSESNFRLNTYKNFLKNNKISFDKNLIVEGNFTGVSGREAVKILLNERKVDFDIIIAANDEMALGAIEELAFYGLQVPGDMYVVGFDDIEASKNVSLTTIKQPLKEQGYNAASSLLKLINNKEVNNIITLSTELVIRESCGCKSKNIETVPIWEISENEKTSDKKFKDEQSNIKDEIAKTLTGISDEIDNKAEIWANKIIEGYNKSFQSNKPSHFLNTWNKIMFEALSTGLNLSLLQQFISTFRKKIIFLNEDKKKQIFIEDLLHQSRVMIEEFSQKSIALEKIVSAIEEEKMNFLDGKLTDSNNLKDHLDIINNEFPSIGIKQCYLSLFENPKIPEENSNLVLAYNKNERIPIDINKEIIFPTKDLIPDKYFTQKEKYNFVLQPLFHIDQNIGFIILDMGNSVKNALIFDSLASKISSTLRLIMLIEKITSTAQYLENEIIERKKAELKLKEALEDVENYNKILHELSLTDELTGLYNRRGFITLCEQHLKYTQRNKRHFTLFYCDMDGLKSINDNYGHNEGDNAIKEIGNLLQKSFRGVDIIARIGGDEFTVLATDTNYSDIEHIRKRINEKINEYNSKSEKPYNIALSIGEYFFDNEENISFDDMLKIADEKLYKIKKNKYNK